MGHVFSPYYARARRTRPTDPESHCALNVALYGDTRRWALTERTAPNARTADTFALGQSALTWHADHLRIALEERSAPRGTRLAGDIRLTPSTPSFDPVELAPGQTWWPVAPCARIEVNLTHPRLSWSGRAYHDTNYGDAPLDTAFGRWTWLRALHPEGTAVGYHIAAHNERPAKSVGNLYRHDGSIVPWTSAPLAPGPSGRWGVAQQFPTPYQSLTRCEDTPFYTRNRVHLDDPTDGPLVLMHESLDLHRFAQPWVQFLVPFRMRRTRHDHAPNRQTPHSSAVP